MHGMQASEPKEDKNWTRCADYVYAQYVQGLQLVIEQKARDHGGGGAGRAAAPPLFCAPAPTFCAEKKNN